METTTTCPECGRAGLEVREYQPGRFSTVCVVCEMPEDGRMVPLVWTWVQTEEG